MAESFVQLSQCRCVASFVEACFVVGLANVGTDGDIVVEVIVAAHVHADGEAVERSCFVVENVHVDGRLAIPFVLVSSYAEVVPSHRSRELEQVAVIIDCRLSSVTFDHEVVGRLFFESANLDVVELRRNARNIGVTCAGIEGEFGGVGMWFCIPINLGFVFSVRGVPHDFGAVASYVTDGDVGDVRVFDRAECSECVWCLRAIDEVFCLGVFGLVCVRACDVEVIGRTRL